MELIPIKSVRLRSGSDLIQSFQIALDLKNLKLKERDVIIIASKVVSYSEGNLVKIEKAKIENRKSNFQELVKKEADRILDEGDRTSRQAVMIITLKNKILIPNAGIDSSNTPKGEVILWPKNPFKSAEIIRRKLMDKYNLKRLGVVISDSHCQPLRAGTSGIAIAWAGFYGVRDERGNTDLFGKKMVYTKIAIADNLASAATLEMGETDASIPFVIARDVPVNFTNKKFSPEDYFISPKECIYRVFYNKNLKTYC